MWLKILLFLGIVVCSFSAPTPSPAPVTQPWNHVSAIKEALILLDNAPDMEVSEGERDEDVEIVSEEFSVQKCVQERLQLYEKGLRGNLTKLKGTLKMMASHYQNCSTILRSDCKTHITTYDDFVDNLRDFLTTIPFDCWKPVQK
ncbi:granulocyte-macrophage colony-stimulating factor [Peromyscus leucopus]|uniref:granulocyte-macrophage colony-stimulating factor n=1 Tax=Peromyscus leucopus TaxID=10041 RepID=UPI001884FFF9|nr:granulocyte-macrophage colony-stimulating factor [Peromyscus leucopus]